MRHVALAVLLIVCPVSAQAGYLFGYATGIGVSPMGMIGAMQRRANDEAARKREEERKEREQADPSLLNRTPQNRGLN